MNYKKITINTIIIFLICSLFHFGYSIFPNFFTSLFFPVNESTWEHLKMIFTASLVFTFINDLIHHNKNTFIRAYSRSMLTIIILLILYLPINYIFGENMIVTLIILFISIFISEMITSKISTTDNNKSLNTISLILLIINFIVFALLTYYPIKADLFYDKQSDKYGIDILDK